MPMFLVCTSESTFARVCYTVDSETQEEAVKKVRDRRVEMDHYETDIDFMGLDWLEVDDVVKVED